MSSCQTKYTLLILVESNMMLSKAFLLILVMTNTYIRSLDASCLEGLAHCLGLHREAIYLGCRTLQREYREYPDDQIFQAYQIIGEHLQKAVREDQLKDNLGVIRRLIELELAVRDKDCRSKNKKILSCKLESEDASLMINALIRLLHLGSTADVKTKCLIITTRGLSENNRLAKDPLGRHVREEGHILPRIDRLIFNATLDRARECLAVYQNRLTALNSRPRDSYMDEDLFGSSDVESNEK